MPRWKSRFAHSLVGVAFFAAFAWPQAQTGPGQTADSAKLALILQKTADYCRRLEGALLDFVCIEEVKETLHYEVFENDLDLGVYRGADRAQENTFLYEYQLIRNADKTEETRTLIEKDGKKRREKATGVGTLRFRFENIIYGPVDLLKRAHQPHFNYSFVREEPKPEEGTIIIQAVPDPSEQEYCPFGKIWVRERDFAILKIDYDQRSIKTLYAENRDRSREKGEPQFELTSEFGVEKNGIRFPSRLVFQEVKVDKSGTKDVRSRAEITYRDYKFFTVTVDVDYK
jgi:hypothetical protein